MVKVKIIGAAGYGGVGIIELLLRHPEAEIVKLVGVSNIGRPISDLYPHLKGFCDLPLSDAQEDNAADGADVAFSATPDGVAQDLAARYLDARVKLVDYSGDFRFRDPSVYAEYARRIGRDGSHQAADLLPQATYGLTELHRNEVRQAPLVGNPGCFAVSVILGFAPAVKVKAIALDRLIADAKTGVSGAGKKPTPRFHYPEQYENQYAYKIGCHQHQFEIEQELGRLAGSPLSVLLTTQVVPLCRGILSCCYGRLEAGWMDPNKVRAAYEDFYADEPFVRIVEAGCTADVRGTNFCHISVHLDQHTGTLLAVSHIDNLVKGQAGSALQNMNVMCGLAETAGLLFPGNHP